MLGHRVWQPKVRRMTSVAGSGFCCVESVPAADVRGNDRGSRAPAWRNGLVRLFESAWTEGFAAGSQRRFNWRYVALCISACAPAVAGAHAASKPRGVKRSSLARPSSSVCACWRSDERGARQAVPLRRPVAQVSEHGQDCSPSWPTRFALVRAGRAPPALERSADSGQSWRRAARESTRHAPRLQPLQPHRHFPA